MPSSTRLPIPDVAAPAGELPPFIVHVHGGPTSNSLPVLSLEKAFFTSRGIGVIDVNYGGSTGYGRAYRERLRGQWGVVDVADAMHAALALAESGEADRRQARHPGRLGGRLDGPRRGDQRACADRRSEAVFAAATSYFGVSDLRPFAIDTHDFESRYLDGLIGPLPEADALYVERAPVGHVTPLTCPVLLLQGLDDPIVPPSQSEAIAARPGRARHPARLHRVRGRVARLPQGGDDHRLPWRRSWRSTAQVFGFTPPGVAPIKLS